MKKSRDDLGKMNKAKCKELKQMRKEMAEQLGVDLHQRECTYEGFCTGTCPKCKQEEKILNAAIKKQKQEGKSPIVSKRYAAAGIMVAAAVSLSGCGQEKTETLTGDVAFPDNEILREEVDGLMAAPVDEPLEGEPLLPEDDCDVDIDEKLPVTDDAVEVGDLLEGDIAPIDEMDMLEGDVVYPEDEIIYEGKVVEVTPDTEDDYELVGEIPDPAIEEEDWAIEGGIEEYNPADDGFEDITE